MRLSVLAIGSELLDGRVVDTNSRFIGESVTLFGGEMTSIVTVTDKTDEILQAISFAAARSDVIILSGGLGPTTDDCTRETVSQYTGKPLLLDEASLLKMKQRFAARNRPFDPSNEKQALYPSTGTIVPNPVGTAPGFAITHQGVLLIALPGVPRELEAMWNESILPLLTQHFSETNKKYQRGFKVFNRPESEVGAAISSLGISHDVFVSYRARFPEIEVKLSSLNQHLLDQAFYQARKKLGADAVFTEDLSQSFPEVIAQAFKTSKISVATAESCTGGIVAKFFTDIPGSSHFFKGGVSAYDNTVKLKVLGVKAATLQGFGAVSSEVAAEMALGVRALLETDYAVSITGIAGPDGGTQEKPVGIFFIGVASSRGARAMQHFFPGTRKQVRLFAAYMALREIAVEAGLFPTVKF